ncbi:MAG TPA: hypothetical protein VFH85_03040 [Gammaproteobacteria bacterium]|nr:hypothetical protein [Gammaproteobacteria bacterium]
METRDNLMTEARAIRREDSDSLNNGLASFAAADSLYHVETAWQLVYERYLAAGFIGPNPYRIHTSRHALHNDTCVVFGRHNDHVTSTMTMLPDGDTGLSLDSVYRRELAALRTNRRRLLEVGLLVADSSANAGHDMNTLFELMKWGVYYALHLDITDIVVGVHPHHARFYTRCFAFEQYGPEKVYPLVRNKPVVLLRLRVKEQLALQMLPRGLRHVRDNPLPGDAFRSRYELNHANLEGSMVERFFALIQQPEQEEGRSRRRESRLQRPLNLMAMAPA